MPGEFIARNGMISRGNVVVTGSLTTLGSLTTTGTITATTLVVQTITSSISSITGSTNFGSLSTNTHTFTGSVITSGSVGIGTTPAHSLTLVGGQTTPGSFSAGNYTFGIYSGSVSTALRETFAIGSDASYIYMQSFSSRPLYINSAGNNIILGSAAGANSVGIGTPSPNSTLHVSKGGVSFQVTDTSKTANNTFSVYGLTQTSFAIATGNSGSFSGGEKIVINDNGNIGIGTTSPTDLLHLYKSGTVYQKIETVSGGAGTIYRRSNSTTPDWTIGHGAASANENFEVYTAGTGAFTWTMNGAERMRIYSNGNISIGITTNPWTTLFTVLDINTALSVASYAANYGGLYGNIYYASGNYYFRNTGYGTTLNLSTNTGAINMATWGTGAANAIANPVERFSLSSTGTITLSGPTLSSGTQSTYTLLVGEVGSINLTLSHKASTGGYIQTWQSTPLYLNQQGNAVYAGAVRLDTLSDQRIKDNIQPISGSLNKVLQLNGKKFHLKDEPEDKIRYGFIAQDLEGILDEFIIQTDMTFTKGDLVVENVKSIENWASSWAALLVEAIKELKSKNDTLEARVQELENK